MAQQSARADNLPPPHQRHCVTCGMATVGPKGRLTYDWEMVEKVWLIYTGNLEAFGLAYQIPYQTLVTQAAKFDKEAKAAIHAASVRGFRSQVLSIVESAAEAEAGRLGARLSRALDDMEAIACMGLAFARGKMLKISDGVPIVNPFLSAREVKECVQIAQAASRTLHNVIEIERESHNLNSRKTRKLVVTQSGTTAQAPIAANGQQQLTTGSPPPPLSSGGNPAPGGSADAVTDDDDSDDTNPDPDAHDP